MNCFKNAYDIHYNEIKGLKLTQALATQEDIDFLNEIYRSNKFKLQ